MLTQVRAPTLAKASYGQEGLSRGLLNPMMLVTWNVELECDPAIMMPSMQWHVCLISTGSPVWRHCSGVASSRAHVLLLVS